MQVQIVTDRYVHFDSNGNLTKIARSPDEHEDSIKVDFNQVKSLLEGKESLVDYKVEYDFLEKKYMLKHIKLFNQDQLKDAFMMEISSCDNADITIVRDKKQKVWRLKIGKDLLTAAKEQNILIDPTLQHYSITKKYDPNILYRLIKFEESENEYVIPFEYDFEVDNVDVSIYTTRKYSTYSYEVIDG